MWDHAGNEEGIHPAEVVAAQTLRKETLLQKPEGLLLTKAGGLLINKWEIMVVITSSLVLIELS